MPATVIDKVAAQPRRGVVLAALAAAGLVAVGLISGLVVTKLADDPHAARSETLTGTAIWSNERTRLIAFEQDGVRRDPNDDDTLYSVIADGWQDAAGTSHSDETYPRCLAAEDDGPVSMDHHRVQLEVIHRTTGGGHAEHIAVQVRCLD
jgi:hypothetical protein